MGLFLCVGGGWTVALAGACGCGSAGACERGLAIVVIFLNGPFWEAYTVGVCGRVSATVVIFYI